MHLLDENVILYVTKKEEMDKFVLYALQRYGEDEPATIYDLNDSTSHQLERLIHKELNEEIERVRELRKERSANQVKLDENRQYLATVIDEEAVQNVNQEMMDLSRKLGLIEGRIPSTELKIRDINGLLNRKRTELQRLRKETVGSDQVTDEEERIEKYALMAKDVLEVYRIRLQKRRVKQLADTMTECYLNLTNKTNLIRTIQMDPKTLDLAYFNSDGVEVDPESLSAGEKQLMVISLLWALAISSKQKLPVIVDTPLSRLDREHRKAIVSTYYPNASEQIIILSTDTEITPDYYEILKPYIDCEYLLEYNEEERATHVKPGYFQEVE